MTSVVEINFDGIVGPSHNFAGLSAGNMASQGSAGRVSHPRAAALEGIAKMRANLALGLTQGVFVPPPRPNSAWLAAMGIDSPAVAPSHLRASAMSASAMWAANAATVSPAADTTDGRCHLTVANLLTMPHRAHEAGFTLTQLRTAFAHPSFAVHAPVPSPFGDEGAANHMRLTLSHDAAGVEVFVYGEHATQGDPFPSRQHGEASRAVARLNHVARPIFALQSPAAIAAGAFHNDVVAVANEHVLFAHEHAFADPRALYDALGAALPEAVVIEVPAAVISLADAIATYLFNAQLVTLPGGGGMALILPAEVMRHNATRSWLDRLVAGNGPIRRLIPVDVRGSMANGGGPACLRLRVVCDPAEVDPRFLVDEAWVDRLRAVIERHWPTEIVPAELGNDALVADITHARRHLLDVLDLAELSG